MDLYCPNCSALIQPEDVNVAADLAKCTSCGRLHKVSAVLQEAPSNLPVERPSAEVSLVPPMGSDIILDDSDQSAIVLSTPRKGLTGPHLFIGGFATFWLAFITVWTVGAAMGSIFFALFSIPFWIVGFGLMGSFINASFGREMIRFEEDALVLVKKFPIRPKETRIPYDQIDKVSMNKVNVNVLFPTDVSWQHATKNSGKRGEVIGPTVSMGVKRESFFTSVSEPEMEWIVKLVNAVVKKKQEERQFFG